MHFHIPEVVTLLCLLCTILGAPSRRKETVNVVAVGASTGARKNINTGSSTEESSRRVAKTVNEVLVSPWTVNQGLTEDQLCPEPLAHICRGNSPPGTNAVYSSPFFEGDIIVEPEVRQQIALANYALRLTAEETAVTLSSKEKGSKKQKNPASSRNQDEVSSRPAPSGGQNVPGSTYFRSWNRTYTQGNTRTHTQISTSMQQVVVGGHISTTTSRRQSSSTQIGRDFRDFLIRGKRAVVKRKNQRWPNAVVPYVLDTNFPHGYENVIRASMKHWERKTCIRFVPKKKKHKDFIRFAFQPGCWSFIGKQGGEQFLAIGFSCNVMGTIVHEIGHAIGLWHEQSRRDRDLYIRIVDENIAPGTEGNFQKVVIENVTSLGYPYDFDSIMHYDPLAFTKNGRPTIKVKKKYRDIPTTSLGMKQKLSDLDIAQINAMYSCNADKEVPTECFESKAGDGREYTGEINFTVNGITCQRWTSQWPNKHDQYSDDKKKNTKRGIGNHNYCRNPAGKRNKPWCFTTLKKVRWQYCPIKICK